MANTSQSVGINLIFTADTGQANIQLQELKNTLSNLGTSAASNKAMQPLTTEIRNALDATTKLSAALQTATNVDTGRLDLTKFSQSIRASGMSLKQYSQQLTALGPQGEKAFMQLSQAVVSGETPLKKSNALMGELWNTMKNTAKWQLSSTVLHGFISAVQSAFQYTKDLNKSLNDIRIVTGYSGDRMADFAKQANKAAKALNTTTKAYTDASLIYYQQGLSDSQIEERTAITIKMANVTGQSATEVSDYMTAVWNNFYDGSKSLEYYADVMAKLGAATASSTDEIAAGLEKFSAIADTVGLSYEYATSALATVTAETRQSADVVGTAFKTLLARMEGLKLGDTLEDGTDLNKYSEALAVVGVNIKDASGDLKDMDQILDELGNRWDSLSKDQQVAVAQAVGGIRQYNQLISIMDNWDVMKMNLAMSEDAEGTLQAQADIYAKSWKAASDQVKTSLESVYSDLINDEVFIDMTNGLADFIGFLEKMIGAIGGLPGLISLIGVALLHAFGPHISESINNMWSNFLLGVGIAQKQADQLKQEMLAALTAWNKDASVGSASYLEVEYQKEQLNLAYELQGVTKNLSEEEKLRLQQYLGIVEAMQQAAIEAQRQSEDSDADKLSSYREVQDLEGQTYTTGKGKKKTKAKYTNDDITSIRESGEDIQRMANASTQSAMLDEDMSDYDFTSVLTGEEFDTSRLENLGQIFPEIKADIDVFKGAIEEADKSLKDMLDGIKGASTDELEQGLKASQDELKRLADEAQKAEDALKKAKKSGNKEEISQAEANLESSKTKFNEQKSEVEDKQSLLDYKKAQEAGDEEQAGEIKKGLRKKTIKKKTSDPTKDLKKSRKNIQDYNKDLNKSEKAMEEWADTATKGNKKAAKAVADFAKKSKTAGNDSGAATAKIKNQEKVLKDYRKALQEAKGGIKDFGAQMTNGLQGMSSFAMGLTSMKGAWDAFTDPDLSGFEKITSVLMSLGMGIPSLVDGLGRMKTGFAGAKKAVVDTIAPLTAAAAANKANAEAEEESNEEKSKAILITKAKTSETTTAILTTAAETEGEKANAAETKGATAAKAAHSVVQAILNALTGVYGVALMVIAIIILALIAVIIVLVTVMTALANAKKKENEETLKQEQANQELINSNQELSDSVSSLTEEYQKLKSQGESTYETMEKLKEQVPDLIDSYKELNRTIGTDINIGALEAAFEKASYTGNWEEFIRLMEEADKKVAEAEKISYKSGATAGGRVMAYSEDLQGIVYDDEYSLIVGGVGEDEVQATEKIKKVFNQQGLSDNIFNAGEGVAFNVDLSKPTEMVNYYEALVASMRELEKAGLKDSDTYREISEEVSALAENYEEAKVQADEFIKTLAADFDANLPESFSNIQTFKDYHQRRGSMITQLMMDEGVTREEAEQIIANSETFKELEAMENLSERLIYEVNWGDTEEQDIIEFINKIPEEDRTLLLNVDMTGMTQEQILEKLEEVREQARIAEIKTKAKELDFDESSFEAYTEILADNNEHLEENSALTAQIALNNARLQKGLNTLASEWENISHVLTTANRSSYDYAEAIGKIKDALEEAFDYKPTTKFIENNLNKIRELASGNVDVLDELQGQLAIDYIMTMEVATSISDEGLSTDEVRNELLDILNSIDTSIELGEGTTISDTYMNSLQEMLDNAQITEEQLRKALRMKGIEMEVSGYKKVKGPSQVITQHIDGPGPLDYSKTITEDTWIEVPIINGDDSSISSPASKNSETTSYLSSGKKADATFVKSPDSSTIDIEGLKENSGAKENEKKIKELKKEKDHYHDIDRELQKLENDYDDLEAAAERAFGNDKLALIDQQVKSLEKQIEVTEKQKQKAEELAKVYQDELIKTYGMSFYTDSGEIANFEEVEAREIKYLQEAYATNDSATIEAAQERYDNFRELMDQYEAELDKQTEAEKNAAQLQAQIYDKHLEGIEYELEVKLKIDDSQLEYLDYLISKTEDDPFKAAQTIVSASAKTEELLTRGDHYINSTNQLLEKHGVTMDQVTQMTPEQLKEVGFTDAELDSLIEWQQGLIETNQSLLETKTLVEESLMPLYEAWGEKFDLVSEKIDHASSVLTHYQNVIDLVGKKRLGMTNQDLIDLADGQLKVAESNLQAAQTHYEAAVQSRKDAEEALNNAKERLLIDPTNEQLQRDVAYWEDIFNQLDTDVREQEQNRNDMLEAALEAAAEKYRLITESILEDFEKGLSKTGESLEKLSEKYDRQGEIDERYVDDYEKMYELNKLSRELDTKLASSISLKEQKSLIAQLERINKLKQNGVKMSDHDLQVLQKQIELEQARIAMQEAQDAKTQVIRRRDSEGNWGYVYTANVDNLMQATQNYEDKMFELTQLNEEYLNDLGDKILQAQIEMREALAALSEEDFASRQEYLEKVEEVKNYYDGLIKYYYEEMNKTLGYNSDIYTQDLEFRLGWSAETIGISQQQLVELAKIRREDYNSLDEYYAEIEKRTGLNIEAIKKLEEEGTLSHIQKIGEQIGANDDLQTSFTDTRLAQTTEFTSMSNALDAFTSTTKGTLANLSQAYKNHAIDLDREFGYMGTDVTTFAGVVKTQLTDEENGVVGYAADAAEATKEMKDEMNTQFTLAVGEADTFQRNFSTKIQLAIDKAGAFAEKLGIVVGLIERLLELFGVEVPEDEDESTGSTTEGGGTGSEPGNASGNSDGNTDYNSNNNIIPTGESENLGTITKARYYYDDEGNRQVAYLINGKDWYTHETFQGQNNYGKRITEGAKGIAYNPNAGKIDASEVQIGMSDRVETNGEIPYYNLKETVGSNGLKTSKMVESGESAKISSGKVYGVYVDAANGLTYYKVGVLGNLGNRWFLEDSLIKLDTGGYTGAWGAEGRMAMLHQKELVLNAHDTENFLLATNVLRDIVSKIELRALTSGLNYANIFNNNAIQDLGRGLEQNIVIHAEFPDATDHTQIEQAFDNLLNRASQFANRK